MLYAFAARMPGWYVGITVVLALFACAYLFAFPVLACVFAAAAVRATERLQWLAVAQNALAGGACALVSYWLYRVRPTAPRLYRLHRANAPRLFDLIDSVGGRFAAPRPATVLLDESTDVRLLYVSRSAYPFAFSRTLVIGLPALQLFSPRHLEGLLVRRLGQAARPLRRLGGWLTIARSHGPALLAACPDWRQPAHLVVRAFFAWFAPLFTLWSTPIARREELYGDRCMMDLVNDRDVAELICLQVVARRYLRERYFPSVLALSRKRSDPAPNAYSGLDRRFNRYWSQADARRWLQQAWRGEVAARDPYPSLRRRLREIGHRSPHPPAPLRQAASRAFLGKALKQVLGEFDRAWMRRAAPQWRQTHATAREELRRLHSLQGSARQQVLGTGAARELAALVEKHYGGARAKPFFERLLDQHPYDARTNFAAGRFLCSLGDLRGRAALKKAARLDRRFAATVRRLLEDGDAAGPTARRAGAGTTRSRRHAAGTGMIESARDSAAEPIDFTPVAGFEFGFISDEHLALDVDATSAPAGSGSGMQAAVSESGLHGTAAIESALRRSVGRTGQTVLATEPSDDSAGAVA